MSVKVSDIEQGIRRIDSALTDYNYSNAELLNSLRLEGVYMLELASVLTKGDLEVWLAAIRQACFMASRSQFA